MAANRCSSQRDAIGMSEIHYLNLVDVSERIRTRQLSSQDVTKALLERIEVLDGRLRSYLAVLPERAMEQARIADAEIGQGHMARPAARRADRPQGPLPHDLRADHGGHENTRRTTCRTYNATIVDRLELAGAVTLGKLKMTEGAYTSHHPEDPAPRNPWNPEYWVGSSSTGSGVATSRRAVLWFHRQRHRRLNPVSVRHLWPHRPETDLGPRQQAWHLSAWRTRSITSVR